MKNYYYLDLEGNRHHRIYHWNSAKFFTNLFILIIVVSILLISFSTKTKADQTPQAVIVKTGDTLWKIAQSIRPEQDPRFTIESIRDVNHLYDVTVQPGQKILVP